MSDNESQPIPSYQGQSAAKPKLVGNCKFYRMLTKEGEVVHLVTREIVDLSHLLADVGNRSSQILPDFDQGRSSENIIVKARNFH